MSRKFKFHGLDAAAFVGVQARVRTCVVRTFVRHGLIERDDATEMRAWAHEGDFSVDASARIEGTERTGPERLAHLCRSAFRSCASASTRCRTSGLSQPQASVRSGHRRPPAGAVAHATRTDDEGRRPGAATQGRLPPLLVARLRPLAVHHSTMRIATGTVISGKVVLDDVSLIEGTDVFVVTRERGAEVRLSPEELAELEAGLAVADRGETMSGEELFARLRRYG